MDMLKIYKVVNGASIVNCVDGRELHALLEVKQKFTSWITHYIKTKKLVENKDYFMQNLAMEPIHFVDESPYIYSSIGTMKRDDYQLTVDAAITIVKSSRRLQTRFVLEYLQNTKL